MAKEEALEINGQVTERLPDAMFKVKLPNGKIILAHVSGKMRMHYIKILPGDTVKLAISPYSLDKARIIYRFK
ncbi:MAG TPA: translation initiation factor IF-1 [Deltaproteobacteria bacterium]|nr:translation initiation factor IF-1 [Campylobacterota bacterium]GMT43389.1 MAG: translation initiation factor IF-1 [bacterium]HDH10447.1 translation initiation factor IF-1 [Deltaproteobacteria bacterium]